MSPDLVYHLLTGEREYASGPAYDEATAASIARDCLAVFTQEVTAVTQEIRHGSAGPDGADDVRYVPTRPFDRRLSDDDSATAEAISLQVAWYGPPSDDF